MLIEILKHTPLWVYLLFALLLAAGLAQSKDRRLGRVRVSTLPLVMAGLSFFGLVADFGLAWAALVCWTISAAASSVVGLRFASPGAVTWSEQTREFSVPGSWLPLVLMMAIFVMKFAVAVVVVRQLPLATESTFVVCVSLGYGLFSGLFLTRTLRVLKAAKDQARLP
ncbi:DUF6622 family protein [Uliginosibacterium sp. TH139]|uniref:DUF6622 family protein n=1 Tax=Uliginosibacterium sp. TH139 TaxID=2067453 RepID=UPI000C7DE4C2|nr:DUF6622 family protein [Uliginosibacterium sp. TH139]PLK50493.1 hypothetical protein C0V76_01310 [Uliginosibacterium sp. TH139]